MKPSFSQGFPMTFPFPPVATASQWRPMPRAHQLWRWTNGPCGRPHTDDASAVAATHKPCLLWYDMFNIMCDIIWCCMIFYLILMILNYDIMLYIYIYDVICLITDNLRQSPWFSVRLLLFLQGAFDIATGGIWTFNMSQVQEHLRLMHPDRFWPLESSGQIIVVQPKQIEQMLITTN